MAKRCIETSVEINAPAAVLWGLLTDFVQMPTWNPFITAISGNPAVGERLSVTIAPPGKSAMRFAPKVLAARPERELRWLGHLLVPGLFDGEHYFLLNLWPTSKCASSRVKCSLGSSSVRSVARLRRQRQASRR